MAIKAGTILHDAQGFVIDRIQTGGVSALNIPQEKVYELGNYQTVGTVRDTPDLTFDIESFDVSTEIEALLAGSTTPNSASDGTEYDFATTYPLDIISPFKAGNGAFNIVKGIVVPYLSLDTVAYTFGVKANASEKFTMKGDAVYYVPGSPYYQSFSLINNTLTYNLAHTAIAYTEAGDTLYVLGACVKNLSTGAYKRLFFGTDSNGYTNTSSTITTQSDWFDSGYTTLHVVYGSTSAATYSQSVNANTSVKPAAIRSKDILCYVGSSEATSSLVKWDGVQQVQLTRKVNLTQDEEFGNSHYISNDYDTADVTGSITLKPPDTDSLWQKIAQVAGVNTNVIAGPISAPPVEVTIKLRDPDTGNILKSFNVPDARFTIPGIAGRVQQHTEVKFDFQSDAGLLSIFKAAML